jgi:hypothetical protein
MYCSSRSVFHGKTFAKKAVCPFYIWANRRENLKTGEAWDEIGRARCLEHTRERIVKDGLGLEENVAETISLTKRIGIPTFLICDFVREQFGVPANIRDVQKAGLNWGPGSSAQEGHALGLFFLERYGEVRCLRPRQSTRKKGVRHVALLRFPDA